MVTVNITNFGRSLLVKALYNEAPIEFVSMKFGNGDVPEDYTELTELVNPLLEVSLSEMTKGENFIQLTCVFDNSSVENDFLMTEIGVFAQDAEYGKGLFAYVNQEDDPEPIKSRTSNKLKENSISVQIIVDDTQNVTAVIKSLAFATKADLEDHIHNYNNPHKVTKEQIGLGDAENYPFNDAPIEFKASKELVNIASKETLSVMFGKIYTAIKSFINHLRDFDNPHNVTALQIGAAAAGHTHSASDMTRGTLSVQRGGTGKGSWTKNRLFFASGESEISQVESPTTDSVLMQDAKGAPRYVPFSSLEFCSTSAEQPDNHNIFWIDPTPVTGGLKYYDGNGWVHVPVAYTE